MLRKTISSVYQGLFITQKTHHDLQAAADRRGQQQKVHWYSLDLSKNYSEIEAVFDRIEHELGPIHILINNAGTIVQGAFDDIPVSVFEDQMALNFYTAVYPTRCVVPRMKGRGFGHISFVSSAAGQFAIWGYSSYSASKFALRGLADAVQMELLPYNISVSVLCPPNTETDVFKTGDHLVSHALEIATYLGPSRHDNPSKPGGGSLQAVPAARHGCNVGKRFLACPIDKINGFTHRFGQFVYNAGISVPSRC
ncbi:hypothetical protein Y032_0498g2522 [Ancylostoma ceylanicum]|uniref:Oxidoreductase, short chain dehydrogenase/reductase family protein n=2 Tax=Ancylostoma ceylanicum TaxID=53326 RepID=A0A016WTW4_9BILA|nr:hypothetical protein Y032_0498g2522 [Ancylostoma ceylanicum]